MGIRIEFTTENGTRYELDKDAMTWKKLSTSSRSGMTRAQEGKLVVWPVIRMGEPALLEDDAVQPGYDVHIHQTSRVRVIKGSLV